MAVATFTWHALPLNSSGETIVKQLNRRLGALKYDMHSRAVLTEADGKVLIGRDDPGSITGILQVSPRIDIVNDGFSVLILTSYDDADTPLFDLLRARGTEASPTAVQSGDSFGVFIWGGYDSAGFIAGASLVAHATENFAVGATGTEIRINTTPNTTTGAVEVMRITHDGKLLVARTTAIGTSDIAARHLNLANDGLAFQTLMSHSDTQVTLLSLRRTRGTEASPTAIQSGDVIGSLNWAARDDAGIESAASIRCITRETWTAAIHGNYLDFQVKEAGTTTQESRFRIGEDGEHIKIVGGDDVEMLTFDRTAHADSSILFHTGVRGVTAGTEEYWEVRTGAFGSTAIRFAIEDDGHVLIQLDGTVGRAAVCRATDVDTGIIWAAVNALGLVGGGTEVFRVDADTTAGNTRGLIYDNDNALLERISVGAADSGGTGFKVLRIPN